MKFSDIARPGVLSGLLALAALALVALAVASIPVPDRPGGLRVQVDGPGPLRPREPGPAKLTFRNSGGGPVTIFGLRSVCLLGGCLTVDKPIGHFELAARQARTFPVGILVGDGPASFELDLPVYYKDEGNVTRVCKARVRGRRNHVSVAFSPGAP